MTVATMIQGFFRAIFQWWITISPWQQGIRVRLGKHVKLLNPGIHAKLPIVDTIYMQPIRVRAAYIGDQTLTTRDGKAVSLSASIRYEITDLMRLYKTLHNAHDTIEQQAQGVIAQYVYAHELSALSPSDIQEHAEHGLDLNQYGLRVHKITLTSFAVVRTYRLISGEIGAYTGYDQRLDTVKTSG